MNPVSKYQRNGEQDFTGDHLGKIPPQCRDLEEAVLGALLIESESIIEIADILLPEMFYTDSHRDIFTSILSLHSKSQPIDLLTVTEDLRTKAKLEQIGGAYYLSGLTNKTASSANIEYHARIIIQKFIQRELIRISNDVIRECYDDTSDVFDLLDKANDALLIAQNSFLSTNVTTLEQCQKQLLKKVIDVKSGSILSDEVLTCIPFIKLYLNTITVIGAKPGTGKTAFLLSSAKEQAKEGYRVMIISLEMTSQRMTARLIQTDTQIFAKRLVSGNITDQEYDQIANLKLSEDILIDDGIGITNENLKIRLVGLYKKYKFQVLYIDYFQKIPLRGKESTADKQYYLMENQICSFAKQYPVAGCVLSQMTRGKDEDMGLETLRGGGIEQGAGQVYLFSDPYAKENKNIEFRDVPFDRQGKIEVECVKNRDDSYIGGTIYFDKYKQIMMNWNDKPEYSTMDYTHAVQTDIF